MLIRILFYFLFCSFVIAKQENFIEEISRIPFPKKPKIFVCHADMPDEQTNLKHIEEHVCHTLEHCGCNIVRDNPNLKFGGDIEHFMAKIVEKENDIFTHDYVLVFMTKHFHQRWLQAQSGVRKEVSYIEDRLKKQESEDFLIPFLLESPYEECVPISLRPYLFYDLTQNANDMQITNVVISCLINTMFPNSTELKNIIQKYNPHIFGLYPKKHTSFPVHFLTKNTDLTYFFAFAAMCLLVDFIVSRYVLKNDFRTNIPDMFGKNFSLPYIYPLTYLAIIGSTYSYFSSSQTYQLLDNHTSYYKIDRIDLLKNAERLLKSEKKLILSGIGGSGKTDFSKTLYQQTNAFLKLFINGQSLESIYSYLYAFFEQRKETNIIKKLNASTNPIQDCFREFYNFLLNQSSWLIVIDDVADLDIFDNFQIFNEDLCKKGIVIVTTQNKNNHNQKIPASCFLETPTLTLEEQKTLLQKHLKKRFSENEILKFLELIPHYPLDIIITANWLNLIDETFNNAYKKLKSIGILLQKKIKLLPSHYTQNNEFKTRYAIISLLIQQLAKTNKQATDELFKITLCLPDDLNLSIIDDQESQVDVILALQKISLIEEHEGRKKIHPTFQQVMRLILLEHVDTKKRFEILQSVLQKTKIFQKHAKKNSTK